MGPGKPYFVLIPSSQVIARHKDIGARPMVTESIQDAADHVAKWGKPTDASKKVMRDCLEGLHVWVNGEWVTCSYVGGGYTDLQYIEHD